MKLKFLYSFFAAILFVTTYGQKDSVPKPVFDDPVYHGAADPVIVWNVKAKKWWMFYTNRRATLNDSSGVAWVHGTRIGIAESNDGKYWTYKDTANINYRPDAEYTFWAPDIVYDKGIYHMYLTYVPGVFTNWSHPRVIVHLTSKNLIDWAYESTLKLASEKLIDANVMQLQDGTWRLWYNNEASGKTMYYADSKDLYNWTDMGKAGIGRGEGPKVFRWQNKYFMIVDIWKGMDVYSSDDMLVWKKQADRILETPGLGNDDQAIGGHCDVVINNNRAFIYYFTHPGHRKDKPAAKNSFEDKRSVIQLAELKYENGVITCDRDAVVAGGLEKIKK